MLFRTIATSALHSLIYAICYQSNMAPDTFIIASPNTAVPGIREHQNTPKLANFLVLLIFQPTGLSGVFLKDVARDEEGTQNNFSVFCQITQCSSERERLLLTLLPPSFSSSVGNIKGCS